MRKKANICVGEGVLVCVICYSCIKTYAIALIFAYVLRWSCSSHGPVAITEMSLSEGLSKDTNF